MQPISVEEREAESMEAVTASDISSINEDNLRLSKLINPEEVKTAISNLSGDVKEVSTMECARIENPGLESEPMQISIVSLSKENRLNNSKEGEDVVSSDVSNKNCNGAVQEAGMVDITKRFLDATKNLELGELLHDPSFGLFEAMSAIEMMDPKMDAGMICNKGKRTIRSFDQSLKSGTLKLEHFTNEELIGIIDTTICCLVTWLEGHSLAQTVFTNLYLHKPVAVLDKYLRSFCVATLKQVDVIEECVSKAGVFEEEDFQPSVYGYNLATNFTDAKASSMLRECEDDMQKKIKSLKNFIKANSNSDNVSAVEREMDSCNAIVARVKFTRIFHQLLLHLWKRDNLGECTKLLAGCQDSLSILQKTVDFGLARSTDESEPFMLGFELLVNQRLLPPTFPRSTRIKTPPEAFQFLDGLLQRVKNVLKVTAIQNFHGILEFFHSFSETQPCVLSRSLLQLLYSPMRFKKPGIDDMIECMKEAVKGFISPPVLMSKSLLVQNKELSDCVDMFFDRCANPFAAVLMGCGHNRARQRDKLAHLLEDFSSLQCETDRIDGYINNVTMQIDGMRQHGNCFGNWLLYHISKIMIRYVLTGFELELYSVHEFAYIYWYLYEFLYGWLLSSLSRAEAYVAECEASNYEKSGKKAIKNRNKTNTKKTKAYTREVCMVQAEQHLAGGYFKVMMGFINDRKVPLPHKEFDNESVRYRHRFAAFSSIHTPSPVHYLQYKSIADLSSMQPSTNLYVASARSFHQAKQYLELIPGGEKEKDIAEMLKIAKTNFVVVKLLASGHTRESTLPPEFDFSAHIHFPIIKLK